MQANTNTTKAGERTLQSSNPIYCAVQRNAIAHHRTMIRFLTQLYRENKGEWNLRLIKSHWEEIQSIYSELRNESRRIA